jgi:uncharacterized protein
MSLPDRYIPGVPCWVDATQPEPRAAADFYGALFGWELEDVMPPGAPAPYFMARIRGEDVAGIAGPAEGAPPSAVWSTYVWVTDAGETAERVRGAGGEVLRDPAPVGDWGRMALFTDPAGAAFRAWEPASHRGATVVNEHGAVNFNDLHTPDPEGAAAFYGAVFGWELLEMGGGMRAWALPGYGDFLESRMPGMRENMAKMGAPERFEDVVAAIDVVSGGAQATWGVTFGVDDADAAAAKAEELGGRVVTPPFDAPWVRSTVLADPAGATFAANQFVPPSAGGEEAGA